MKIDQRGPFAVVPHPGHQFFRVGARVGRELVAGVPQVVNVDALRADSGQRGLGFGPLRADDYR